jgi:hypothetical protein
VEVLSITAAATAPPAAAAPVCTIMSACWGDTHRDCVAGHHQKTFSPLYIIIIIITFRRRRRKEKGASIYILDPSLLLLRFFFLVGCCSMGCILMVPY